MDITLSPETEMRLRERAQREGHDAATLADTILSDALADDPDDLTDEEAAGIPVGIRRGLAAAAAGRVTALSQAITGTQRRHGFPDAWASEADSAA